MIQKIRPSGRFPMHDLRPGYPPRRGRVQNVFRPRRPYPFPSLGAAAPSPPLRPERPRPRTPDGLKDLDARPHAPAPASAREGPCRYITCPSPRSDLETVPVFPRLIHRPRRADVPARTRPTTGGKRTDGSRARLAPQED
ncbi:hypothetical protein C4B68_11960 [Streptomyces dengpaensis]|uniref:Uncharacterized protein n=1 Tax=Streptomyces dengpaensis TaxID=2049881 RepID=A0ABN5HZD2_9ACTN|nr:hypothetical protein C4B68_11960 [Streptomyces dengpaensis]